MMTIPYDQRRAAFVNHIIDRYKGGEDNALEAFEAAYKGSHEREEGESDLEYVRRCAEQDFEDGELGGAVYQDVFDEVMAGLISA